MRDDIRDEVLHKIHVHRDRLGKTPEFVYLGYDEIEHLRKAVDQSDLYQTKEATAFNFLGVPVMVVNAESHLGVG